MSKKGQAEAMGLLILLILVLLLGFLYLRFSLRGEDKDYASVRESIAAHDLLRALLQLNIHEESFQDLTIACYYDSASCGILRQRVQEIFGSVFTGPNTYHLLLKAEDQTLVDEGTCSQGIVGRIPYTVDGVLYDGILTLCGRN